MMRACKASAGKDPKKPVVSWQGAAQIAVETVREWLSKHEDAMNRVIFNIFSDKDRNIYEALFK